MRLLKFLLLSVLFVCVGLPVLLILFVLGMSLFGVVFGVGMALVGILLAIVKVSLIVVIPLALIFWVLKRA